MSDMCRIAAVQVGKMGRSMAIQAADGKSFAIGCQPELLVPQTVFRPIGTQYNPREIP